MAQADIALVGVDSDPVETAEWLESLQYVLETKGPERAKYLLTVLDEAAFRHGVELPFSINTPYLNTIPACRWSNTRVLHPRAARSIARSPS